MRTLVTYASEHGSTREIAERIKDRLTDHSALADCIPINEVTDLSAYSSIVIGSAVHGVRWMPAATKFLETHAEQLKQMPVWAFSVGFPVGMPRIFGKDPKVREEKKMREILQKNIPLKDHILFNGRFLKDDVGTCFGACLSLMGWKWGDSRDWEAIDAWGNGIAENIARS
jgi:menaquinone-dependent protoporphyrinogen oxidase